MQDEATHPPGAAGGAVLPAQWLLRSVLEFLERTRLDLDRRWLGWKPALFAGERIFAKPLLLGGHLLQANFHETRQGELARTLLVHGAQDRGFQRGKYRLDRLGFSP